MKYYLLLLIPLMLSSCSSIRYVTTDHGRLVTDLNKPVEIVGNPPVVCQVKGSDRVYTGYFMYQDDDGTILLDDYGRSVIRLHEPVVCRFKNEE
jgi:hypothetical protein